MTLVEKIFNCFKNNESFSLQEAYEHNLDKPQETVRARIYEKIGVKLEEKDFGNLKQLIDGCMNNQTLENKRNEIINECWAEIGKGAENTVSWLIKKHSEI